MEVKTVLVTQARMKSTRLPGKVLLEVNKTPLLKVHLDRVSETRNVDKIIVATTDSPDDDIIEKLSNKWGFEVFRGSENDVLDRFYKALKKLNPEWVVRVTSDCPLVDPKLVDDVISFALYNNSDYCSNTIVENFPDGQDVEVFKFKALENAWKEAKLLSEREHVTPFIRNNSDIKGGTLFKAVHFQAPGNFNHIRMTIDEIKDLNTIKHLVSKLGVDATWQVYTDYILNNINEFDNLDITRNEGYLKSLKNDKSMH